MNVKLIRSLLCLSLLPILSHADTEFDINKVSHQFTGFGTQIWARDLSVEPILSDMNMKFVRMDIGSIPKKVDVTAWTDADIKTYFNSKKWKPHKLTAEMLEKYDIKIIFNAFAPPKAWIDKENGSALRPEYYSHYAKRIAHTLSSLKAYGIPAYGIEPFNEPDGDWNGYVNPAGYNQIIIQLRKEMDDLELEDVIIVGPGLAHIDAGLIPWTEALTPEGANSLGAWSSHGYQWESPRNSDPATMRDDIKDSLKASISKHDPKLAKPIIITEYSPLKVWPGNDDAIETDAFAARAVEDSLSLLNGGANIILFWQAADMEWAKNEKHGFLRLDKTKRPIYPALQSVFAHWEAGSDIARAPEQATNSLYSAVAINTTAQTICVTIVNSTDASKADVIRIKGVNSLELIESSYYNNAKLTRARKPNLNTNSFTIELPAHSTQTYKFSYN